MKYQLDLNLQVVHQYLVLIPSREDLYNFRLPNLCCALILKISQLVHVLVPAVCLHEDLGKQAPNDTEQQGRDREYVIIEVRGQRFLHKMVR